jgi:aryl sulfotransferase
MKANSIKFDGRRAADIPVLEPGAMIRKGKVGSAREDGMTQDISSHLRALGSRVCPDEEARQWFYEGGPLPT